MPKTELMKVNKNAIFSSWIKYKVILNTIYIIQYLQHSQYGANFIIKI